MLCIATLDVFVKLALQLTAGVVCLEPLPPAKMGFLPLGSMLSASGEAEGEGECQP